MNQAEGSCAEIYPWGDEKLQNKFCSPSFILKECIINKRNRNTGIPLIPLQFRDVKFPRKKTLTTM
jgi:hypothetical protein